MIYWPLPFLLLLAACSYIAWDEPHDRKFAFWLWFWSWVVMAAARWLP